MSQMASQITSLTTVYSTVYWGADQRKHQSSASLAFVWGIHRWPVISPHKGTVTRIMFRFNDVIMNYADSWADLPVIWHVRYWRQDTIACQLWAEVRINLVSRERFPCNLPRNTCHADLAILNSKWLRTWWFTCKFVHQVFWPEYTLIQTVYSHHHSMLQDVGKCNIWIHWNWWCKHLKQRDVRM